eukprot:CAMPEP_0173437498 /NCGR_PEP_ID=MMETSP1357-20121228/18058_1 /TAXON_ID=77926 /ORGANISM="Hemiselmis rufescens, Strain PCC563" /LENGTH=112 /DNA_ID=CAMNT_0014402679 /DNA_START=36 /DNA_END=370 /DNA_ORIENTATION=+
MSHGEVGASSPDRNVDLEVLRMRARFMLIASLAEGEEPPPCEPPCEACSASRASRAALRSLRSSASSSLSYWLLALCSMLAFPPPSPLAMILPSSSRSLLYLVPPAASDCPA